MQLNIQKTVFDDKKVQKNLLKIDKEKGDKLMYIYNVMKTLIEYASRSNDIPVAAAVVKDGRIISIKRNDSKKAIYHAEILAIIDATSKLSTKDLRSCEMFVTKEPCPMCMSAIVLSKVKRLYFGARDFKMGAAESCFNLSQHPFLNHKVEVIGGICEDECRLLLKRFFEEKRR